MPNIKSAKKRARQSEKRRIRNKHQRSGMRTAVKAVVYAIEAGEKETAATALKVAVPALDKAVSKGLIHKNKAARQKSRLAGRIASM
ncbi:MAG TPA: 30S ribosomal protein S20 [Leucothrix mucor]|uniref:Small ribosomal subunit protein bS20 n=1 Tax=Leucothrix mucor TaxID=45248 RepID=A0A7V2T1K0_LEUMU|nr:30S ribosomal protein S20 [Leucothrix mucor]